MRRDHRPYWLRAWHARYESWWTRHFLVPQFDHLGCAWQVKKPWNVEVSGRHIRAGDYLHLICERRTTTRLCTWSDEQGQGRITIGDYVLLSPGIQILSAASITLGNNCMLAAHVYMTDSDWHGLYDRTRAPEPAAILLEDNVWVGYGAMILKGVEIGANSVIGAGSVVTESLPANVIAAGNPARVIRKLESKVPFIRRQSLFGDPEEIARKEAYLYGLALQGNTLSGWLRAKLAPGRKD